MGTTSQKYLQIYCAAARLAWTTWVDLIQCEAYCTAT
jgi:hypothetical protein